MAVSGRLRKLAGAAVTAALVLACGGAVHAHADGLTIKATFDSSITGSSNAAQLEAGINSAIGVVQSLYGNSVTLSVTFSYSSACGLFCTSQSFYSYSYGEYTSALAADAAANPLNTVLNSAVANLSTGNDANGAGNMAITGGQALMLGNYGLNTTGVTSDAAVSISTNNNYGTAAGEFNLASGLEHELNEVLGGGGAGSTLNFANPTACNPGADFFCGAFGATDLYRYSAPGVTSHTQSTTASSYLSVDGGSTSVVGFNQNAGLPSSDWGDFGDFGPNQCQMNSGGDQYIQTAFVCPVGYPGVGPVEPYTTSSAEFTMMSAIGWDQANPPITTPEPPSVVLLATALLGLALLKRDALWALAQRS